MQNISLVFHCDCLFLGTSPLALTLKRPTRPSKPHCVPLAGAFLLLIVRFPVHESLRESLHYALHSLSARCASWQKNLLLSLCLLLHQTVGTPVSATDDTPPLVCAGPLPGSTKLEIAGVIAGGCRRCCLRRLLSLLLLLQACLSLLRRPRPSPSHTELWGPG